MEIPMVIIYKLSFLTALMGRIFVHIDNVGLPNIVAGRRIVPELIQDDATPSAIAENSLRILKDKNERDKIISELKEVGRKLGNVDASKNAAERIYRVMKEFRSQNSEAGRKTLLFILTSGYCILNSNFL
jgi:lipid-A-disaccharide synthase